jgi:ribosomal protein L37AE/L43A
VLNATHHPLANGRPAEHCMGYSDRLDADGLPLPMFWMARMPLAEALVAGLGPQSSAIFATANHGRWIAECPDCHGAQLTAVADPRFMCVECGNASIGGKWRPVIWPKDHVEISALLDERPRHLANALPSETVKQIRKENDLLREATLIGGDV